MERKTLESTAAYYPYLQGLWAIPFGLGTILTGISNLQNRPGEPVMLAILIGGLGLVLLVTLAIARYYRERYGSVTPTRDRLIRQGIAVVAWVVVLFVGANQYLLWSPDSAMCIYGSAFALATLAYYAILVGLRPHHIVIWGIVFVAGLLPIWGSLGVDRDPLAMIPLGLALILSGILDQRLLARSFDSASRQNLESSNVGG
jgi:hypothetical protein